MSRLISKCPCCNGTLQISMLKCNDCGTEVKNNFELSAFDALSSDQYNFLIEFIKTRGNLKEVQANLGISYLTARNKLDDLLIALNLGSEKNEMCERGENNMSNLQIDRCSIRAADIIKAKLIDNGGHAKVRLFSGELREIAISSDGRFLCPQLVPYDFEVFNAIVDLLIKSPGYRAKKGNARAAKLGEPGCEENTVAGTVLLFLGKKPGQSGFDPGFILLATLEWAGIIINGRGEIVLTSQYISML